MNQDSHTNQGTPQWVERELAHSRHVIANAKIVVTFSATLAATFVSAMLDKSNDQSCLDEAALVLMGFSLAMTLCVVMLPPHHRRGALAETAYDAAKRRAMWAYWLMVVQVIVSMASIVAITAAMRHDLLDLIPII